MSNLFSYLVLDVFELYSLDCLFSMTSFDFCIRTFCVIWWIMVLVAKMVEEVADRKTLQRTVNTAAKIIGAPLPSILDIFLARCSSKTNSIVKDPTHPSHSLFQLLPSERRYRSIRARSARLLNSFFPQAVRALNSDHPAPLWNPMQTPYLLKHGPPPPPPLQTPPNLTTPKKKLCELFCAIQVCYTQVSGPVQTTCSNTLSSMCTRHFFTHCCVYTIPQKTQQYMYVTCSCTTTNHLVLFPSQLLDSQCFSLHMYIIYVKHSHSLYSLYFLFFIFSCIG